MRLNLAGVFNELNQKAKQDKTENQENAKQRAYGSQNFCPHGAVPLKTVKAMDRF